MIRKPLAYSIIVVTLLGFGLKFYQGPGGWWFSNYAAGVFYEIFWILVVFLFFPARSVINKIPIWVFVITCILEALQLWHPLVLERIRSTFLGATLIGTTFSWADFPCYVVGCIVGWLWIKNLNRLD